MGSREDVECWLTDMDGVLVHENHALPGAAELIQQWQDEGTPYLVLPDRDDDPVIGSFADFLRELAEERLADATGPAASPAPLSGP